MQQRKNDRMPNRPDDPRDRASTPGVARPASDVPGSDADAEREHLDLKEERLVARKHDQQVGEVTLRKVVEEVPARAEVEVFHEEIEVEHVPVDRIVDEREDPRREGDHMLIPVYEEKLVTTKRLVLKEYVRVRSRRVSERKVVEDTVRRERLVVDEPERSNPVHEAGEPNDRR